jgi:EF hand
MKKTYPVVASMGLAFALSCSGLGQTTTASPKLPNRLEIASENAKQLLLLMDTDKNGKISKQEWMNFMSAEFDRLDTDKSGELDPKELLHSNVTIKHVPPEVQGK